MSQRMRLPDIEPEWTPRQRQVLELLVRGYTNGEIAEELGVGLEGAKFHVSEILSKLQVQSREEAAEYWRYRNGLRMRFSRLGGSLFEAPALRWVAAGLGVAAAGTIVAVAIVSVLNRDGDRPIAGDPGTASPTPASPAPASPTPLATPAPGPRLTPFPTVTALAHESLAPGTTITGGYGLLFGNPNTGGVEVWLLPEGAAPAGVSPLGRYFVFGTELVDAVAGTRTALSIEGDVRIASFAPDDSALVVQTDVEAALFGNDGRRIAGFPRIAQEAGAEAVWSSDSRGVALWRRDSSTSRTDVLIDGNAQTMPSAGMADWAHEGLRLAVTGERAAIYDFDRGRVTALERGGTFPSWSPDDAYLALDISTAEVAGTSVIDTTDGREVMRIYNRGACFDIGWAGTNGLAGSRDAAVEVPTGNRVPYPTTGPTPIAGAPVIGFDQAGAAMWHFPGGATASVRLQAIWAFSFAWLRRDAAGGSFPPVLFLGLGGKDACIGGPLDVVVAKPPFTADQVPTPTPTPDK